MASSINASTSGGGGVITTADSSGNLNIQSGGSTVFAVTSTGATVTGTLAATGAVSGTTGTFTSTLGVTGAITGSSTVAGSTGILYPLTSSTAVTLTTQTSVDFTSIPSWVKRITVMFSGVSTNGTSVVQIQLGAGSVTTSGYSCMGTQLSTTAIAGATATSGFVLGSDAVATDVSYGHIIFSTLGSNIWEGTGSTYSGATGARTRFTTGGIALGGTLDRVRLTTVNGTDTFDAGSVNILYE